MARWRRLLCLLAAALAGFAALLAVVDKSFTASPELLSAGLAALAFGALVITTWPAAAEWSSRRRASAALTAAGWIMLAGPLTILTIAVAGCACAPGGPHYVPPAPLGVGTREWILLALVSGPILLLAAAALPSRKQQENSR